MTVLTAFARSVAIRGRHLRGFIVHLLSWTSFPVLVLAVWIPLELAAFLRPSLRTARGWIVPAWFLRPIGAWSVFSIIFRWFAKYGINDRTTFPFYFTPWHPKETWTETATRLAHLPAFWWSSLVVVLLCILLFMTCRWILEGELSRRKTALALVYLVLLCMALPLAYDAVPEGIVDPMENKGSFLNMWFDSGNTMLYCMPSVRSKGFFLRHFEKIQPELKTTIHGADHPPGATLALYWLGRMAGAQERIGKDRLRYALATTAFASLSVLAVYFLGVSLFGSRRTGLLSAAFWAAKPATLAYNTFAPDTVYWIFFILWMALTWKVVTAEKRPYGSMVLMGVVLTVLTMINFNWPLLGGMFGVFLSIHAWRNRWALSEWFWRAAIPTGIGFGLLVLICIDYNLNYFAIYRYAFENSQFYNLRGAYHWIMCLIGGQLDICILSGSFTAYIFLRNLPGQLRERPMPAHTLYLAVFLTLYMLAVIFIEPTLKIETSRIWAWITALPIVMVARRLDQSEECRFYALAAVALALLQYYGMRVMLVSCG